MPSSRSFYDPAWPSRFVDERTLSWLTGSIEHVGSTAVPGLDAVRGQILYFNIV